MELFSKERMEKDNLQTDQTRLTIADIQNVNETTMFIEEEEIKIFGQLKKVRRLYLRPANSDIVEVGWIINEDITMCMVCGESFGAFRWPHHCRSCGNLVCNTCSPDVVKIEELGELGEVRVCTQCYWGQHPVHITHVRNTTSKAYKPTTFEASKGVISSVKSLSDENIPKRSRNLKFIPSNGRNFHKNVPVSCTKSASDETILPEASYGNFAGAKGCESMTFDEYETKERAASHTWSDENISPKATVRSFAAAKGVGLILIDEYEAEEVAVGTPMSFAEKSTVVSNYIWYEDTNQEEEDDDTKTQDTGSSYAGSTVTFSEFIRQLSVPRWKVKKHQRSSAEKEATREIERTRILSELGGPVVVQGSSLQRHVSKRKLNDVNTSFYIQHSSSDLVFPAIALDPIPAVVIKTKCSDGRKIFVNLCHHSLIPSLDCDNIHVNHPFYSDYLQLNFIQFTLNNERQVVHVGTLRKSTHKRRTCLVCDMIVNTEVLKDCLQDEQLCDKFFLRILKALTGFSNIDVAVDYDLVEGTKTYKGKKIQNLTITAYSSIGRPLPIQNFANTDRSVRSTALLPATPVKARSYFTINLALNWKWKDFLPPNANIVYTTLTIKQNKFGIKTQRQLILTDEPSLLIVNLKSMTLKGNIPWDKANPPKPTVIDQQTFTIKANGKVFTVIDDHQGAKKWVKKINLVIHNTSIEDLKH